MSVFALMMTTGPAALADDDRDRDRDRQHDRDRRREGRPFAELRRQIEELRTMQQRQLDGLTQLQSMMAQLQSTMTQLQTQYGQLDSRVTTYGSDLAGLKSSLQTVTASVTDLTLRVDAVADAAGGLIVVDSTGAKVGDFVGFSGTEPNMIPLVGLVAETAGGSYPFVLKLFPDRLVGNTLFFSEPNCKPGTAYVKHPSFAFNPKNALSLAAVTEPGMLVWVTAAQVPAAQTPLVTPKSTLTAGACTNFVVPQPAERALPVLLQVDLNPHFVPPFAIQ